MPGRKELNVGVLRPESALIGKTVQSCYKKAGESAMEIIAIMRDGEVVLPTLETLLQENDSAYSQLVRAKHKAALPNISLPWNPKIKHPV